MEESNSYRTPCRESEPNGLDRVRQAAKKDKKLRFTFRYYEDLEGRGWRYLDVSPSAKALKKELEKLHEITDHRQCHKPIPQLIQELNRHLGGWKKLLQLRIPPRGLRAINSYVRDRLVQHLRRRFGLVRL